MEAETLQRFTEFAMSLYDDNYEKKHIQCLGKL
jgi:hypothetical protein